LDTKAACLPKNIRLVTAAQDDSPGGDRYPKGGHCIKNQPIRRKEMELKTLSCNAGPADNPVYTSVQLNGVFPETKLTPTLARRAAKVAFGHDNRVTVFDIEHHYGYRLYRKSQRKFYYG
jgi:hypothetical protein